MNKDEGTLYDSKINEPKYNLKFTFDLDENDINLIHDFVEPEIKFRNSDFYEKDDFLKMEINKENYDKLFIKEISDNENFIKEYYENNCKDFKEDFQVMLSNINPKKINKKPKENFNDKDYLIYDVNKNIFYKKIFSDITYKKTKIVESPKIALKIKRLPINLIDEYVV